VVTLGVFIAGAGIALALNPDRYDLFGSRPATSAARPDSDRDSRNVSVTGVQTPGTPAPSTVPSATPSAGPSATPGAAPPAAAAGARPVGTVVVPESFGAVGDGRTDDTQALQRAFDSLDAGKTLVVGAGKTYRHTAVLRLKQTGSRVMGPGTILATNEAQEAIFIEADKVTLYGGLVLKVNQTTKRFDTHQSCKLRIAGRTDTLIDGITIDGAGGAGIFVGDGSSRFTIRDVRVLDTRADGIHMTNGAHDGTVIRPHVSGQGDDAVVSYADQPVICRNIVVDSPFVENQYHGRGVTVVGGDNIEYRNIRVVSSTSAGVYVAAEGNPYFTYGPRRVRILGGTVTRGNTLESVGHGAVLVFSGHQGFSADDITIDGLKIVDTPTSAPSVVGVRGSAVSNIKLTNLTISGTHPRTIAAIPAGSPVTTSGWKLDNQPFDVRRN